MLMKKAKVFKDHGGEWRWTLHADNGEPISDSDEGYVDKDAALHGLMLTIGEDRTDVTVEIEESFQ
jgi:uncharacterized protein YegP (UPF0339 family)